MHCREMFQTRERRRSLGTGFNLASVDFPEALWVSMVRRWIVEWILAEHGSLCWLCGDGSSVIPLSGYTVLWSGPPELAFLDAGYLKKMRPAYYMIFLFLFFNLEAIAHFSKISQDLKTTILLFILWEFHIIYSLIPITTLPSFYP